MSAVRTETSAQVRERPAVPGHGSAWADRRVPLMVAGLCLAGLFVTLVGLGRESLWLDEAFSVAIARRPWPGFLQLVVHREGFMVPYYLLLRGWIAWGDGEVAVRSLSVIIAVAAIPVCYLLADRLFGRGGFIAASMLAINAFFVQYAQEARGYALALTLTVISTFLFVRAIDEPSTWRWAGYVLVSALSVYAHLFAGFVLLAHLVSLGFLDSKNAPSRRAGWVIWGSLALAVAPLAAYLALTENPLAWIPPPSAGLAARSVARIAGAQTWWGALLLVPLIAAAVVAAIVVGVRAWRRSGRSRATWAVAIAIGWVAIPMMGALVISLVKPVLVERYLLVALPGVVLAVTVGLLGVSRPARIALWGAILILSASQVVALYLTQDKEGWREATAYVAAHADPGDGIAFYRPFGTVPWAEYVDEEPVDGVMPAPVLPVFDWRRGNLTLPRGLDVDALAGVAPRFGRVWLLVSQAPPEQLATVRDVLRHDHALVDRTSFGPLVVELYGPDEGATG